VKGTAIDPGATLAQALSSLNVDYWEHSDVAAPVLVLPGTDDLRRTGDLVKCESEVFQLSKAVMTLVATMSPDQPVAARLKGVAAAEEHATQLLTRIDACPAPTEFVAACRKAIVQAVQTVTDVLDALIEADASSGAPPPPPPPGMPPRGPPPPGSPHGNTASSQQLLHHNGGVLPAGTYTVVASSWKKGDPASFRITVEAEEPVELVPIAAEGAGWDAVTAPNVKWPNGSATVACTRQCNFAVRAIYVPDTPTGSDDDAAVPLAASICEAGTGREIVSVGYSTACRLPAIRLDGGAKYKIVVNGASGAAHRGTVVLRCFASVAGAAVVTE
jgi:hypothetical protein